MSFERRTWLLFILIFACFWVGYATAWDGGDFAYKRQLNISNTNVDEVLAGFPILVHLNSSRIDWTHVQDDLDDLRFVNSAEDTLFAAELENYTVNTDAWIWVNIPSISNTSITTFYVYHGNATIASAWDAEAVWDDDFVFVYHMNDDTTSAVLDSTANDNDGTKDGANEPIETASGQIGPAQHFDGNDDEIHIAHVPSLLFNKEMDISMWIRADVLGAANFYSLLTKGAWTIFFRVEDNRGLYFLTKYTDAASDSILDENFLTATTWYRVGATVDLDAAVQDQKVWSNGGIEDTEATAAGKTINQNADILYLGEGHSPNFDGIIDEIRVSNVTRTTAWHKASYHSETDNLITFGAEQSTGWSGTICGVTSPGAVMGVSTADINSINGVS